MYVLKQGAANEMGYVWEFHFPRLNTCRELEIPIPFLDVMNMLIFNYKNVYKLPAHKKNSR